MKRMPWVLGIVLALVAGLVIGHALGYARGYLIGRNAAQKWSDLSGAAELEKARKRLAELPAEIEEAKKRIAELTADLARVREEAAVARAATPKTAPPEPEPEPSIGPEDRKRSLGAAQKAFREIAAKGQLAVYSPENAAVVKQLVIDLLVAGDLAYPFLEEALDGTDSAERFLAVALLDDLDMEKALPILAKALHESPDDWVRRMASHSLATKEVREALPDLLRAMQEDKDWGVQANSAYGAAKMGEKSGLDALLGFYKDTSHSEQERAGVLGGIADIADPSTAPLFRDALSTSRDDTTLILAIMAVEKMKDQASLGALQALIQGNASGIVKTPAKKAYNTIYGKEVYR